MDGEQKSKKYGCFSPTCRYNITFQSVLFAFMLLVICVTMFLFSTVFGEYYDSVMLTVRHINQEEIPSNIAHEKANHSMKTIYLHTSPYYWDSINFDGVRKIDVN
ncbi:hypothetical protein ScPMuIL_004872 [Solemya velum]